MFKKKGEGGGVKGFLNNVKKNCTIGMGRLPLPKLAKTGTGLERAYPHPVPRHPCYLGQERFTTPIEAGLIENLPFGI